ncbi:hypothetical protein [Thiothrix winogradskyi]|nr:hypothetical protein [Thiothrix winogradskyi]
MSLLAQWGKAFSFQRLGRHTMPNYQRPHHRLSMTALAQFDAAF